MDNFNELQSSDIKLYIYTFFYLGKPRLSANHEIAKYSEQFKILESRGHLIVPYRFIIQNAASLDMVTFESGS